MKKKILIWCLVILLLLGGAGTTWYLFSIGAIGFELPAATDPVHGDLLGMYQEAPSEPVVTEPPVSEPVATEPLPSEPAVTEPLPTEPEDPTEPTDPTDPTEPTDPTDPEEPSQDDEPRQITASTYFVYDLRSKEFVTISGRKTEKVFPASITKLMTSYVALQYLSPEDTFTVGDEIALIDWDSSRAYLKEGDVLTVAQCIDAMLLPSGNDAAYAMATAVGRKIAGKEVSAQRAMDLFVNAMNQAAEDLGMDNSHFETVDGMHLAQHYTCPQDLATLITALMKTPVVLDSAFSSSATHTINDRKVTWKNTNSLLNPKSSYYNPNAMGLKTGYTSYAGNCLLSLFFDDDRLYLIGTFDCPGYYDRFADTRQLYQEWIANN